MRHQNINPNEKLAMAEILLCAGAEGVPVAEALAHASATYSLEMVRLLVSYGASLEYQDAVALKKPLSKECLELLPKEITYEDRQFFLNILLKQGAAGDALDEALIDSTEAGDTEAVRLLVTPLFSANEIDIDQSAKEATQTITLGRHKTVSNDYKGALALQVAVKKGNVEIARLILTHMPPSHVALAQVYPSTRNLPKPERYQLTELFLQAGLSGPCVHSALENAINEHSSRHDEKLISLFLQYDADVNFNEGHGITSAIAQNNHQTFSIGLLEKLLNGKPTALTVTRAIPRAMEVADSSVRLRIINMLLASGIIQGAAEVSIALDSAITTKPTDKRLIRALLQQGNADVNINTGSAVEHAAQHSDPEVLELILGLGEPSDESVDRALKSIGKIPASTVKTDKLGTLLSRTKSKATVSSLLIEEVQILLKMPPVERNFTSLKSLLSNGADINASNGEALSCAVAASNGGMPPNEVNRALVFTIQKYPNDIPLINALLTRADTSDGLALVEAIKNEKQDIFELILDGDLEFGTILVENGGSIEHRDGQIIIEACKSGAIDVLEMLLSGNTKISLKTMQRGFQGATQVGNLKKRAEIFRLLLRRGVSGEVIDIQLVSAVRYGDEGRDLVKLLLAYGASPDYSDGEAVEKAVRSAFLGSLELLLGIAEVDEHSRGRQQKKPSSHTLVRGLDACWDLNRDTRFTVIDWLFKAGKLVPSAVHSALHRAVNEHEPEERLIQTLLNNRASPVVNNCQTLIDATLTLPASLFDELLESRVTSEDASFVFRKAFRFNDPSLWVSERGLKIATSLLEKGAEGDGVGSALVAVLKQRSAALESVTNSFTNLLLKHGADINYNRGEALQLAAGQGNAELLTILLNEKPNTEALTWAFPRIFDAPVTEDKIHELINLFTEPRDRNGRLDVMFEYPGDDPVVIRALSQYPRSIKILDALFDMGFYYDQMTTSRVNFETATSHVTPLMIAIRTRRQDVARLLLLAGAEVDVTDALGNSPLSMASAIGGDLAVAMMSNLLAAGASKNDGSLHNAARELNIQAMRVLVEYKHDPDFPSPLHGGRSALAELCLHAADSAQMTLSKEKAMERTIEFLVQSGTDITIQSEGKSVLLLALESANPLTTTRVLLRAALWKEINKTFNQYNDGKYTMGPTMYVQRVLPDSDNKAELLRLLRSNRCIDVYYANSGPQPVDSVGVPSHIQREEEERRARLDRVQRDNEQHTLAIQRNKELAEVQSHIWATQAELEEARKKRAHSADLPCGSSAQNRTRICSTRRA
ncbi:hypothetical protein ONZ43_g743 [Nemania bipapillata]|uniref:Uncharacterized protein n=1 Tax=Nemania bipapillata TaxID=110536 RepID=A0ACC2J7I1_9PEZI|nr:hypothetical protein ONZ43_g743 [Nemania bipapillata]